MNPYAQLLAIADQLCRENTGNEPGRPTGCQVAEDIAFGTSFYFQTNCGLLEVLFLSFFSFINLYLLLLVKWCIIIALLFQKEELLV